MSICQKVIYVLVILSLIACTQKTSEPITIGINSWPGYEFLYLAKAKNLFEEEGVNVKLVRYGSLSDARRAFERGQLDGMTSTLIEVAYAHHFSKREPQVVFVADYSNGADVILAHSEIKQISELRGKRVGLEPASMNEFMLRRALQMHGMTISDISRVYNDQSSMKIAFEKGEMDAVVTYPPISISIMEGHVNKLFSSDQIPGEVVDVVSLAKDVIEKRPTEVQAILRSWQRALDYAQQHPDEAYRIMAEAEGIRETEFKKAMMDLTLVNMSEQVNYFGPQGTLKQTVRLIVETIGKELGDSPHPDCCLTNNFIGTGQANP